MNNTSFAASPLGRLLCVILAGAALTSGAAVTAYADETAANENITLTAATADTPDSLDIASSGDTPKEPVPGDVDLDGIVTSNDALMILRHSIELESIDESVLALADMDGDGYITSADALAALKAYIGEPDPTVVIPSEYTAACGERLDLHPTLSPDPGDNKIKFTYEIAENAVSYDGLVDEDGEPFNVLEFTNTGKIKAFHPGTAVVKVKASNGSSAKCTVTVANSVTKQTISSGGRSLTIYKHMMTNNDCYYMTDDFTKIDGVAVHSTATPGVMAGDWYKAWNRPNTDAAVHSFLDDTCVYNYLPLDQSAWHAGQPANKTFLDFEICEPGGFYYEGNSMVGYNPGAYQDYFNKIWANATLYTAYLCKLYGLNADNVMSHNEIGLAQLGTHHGDPDHWFVKHGRDMDDFRKDVAKILAQGIVASEETVIE